MAHIPHKARKRFGQHFLADRFIIDAILETLQLRPNDNVIEIGPGLGALTKPLLQQLNLLTVIELDRDLIAHLRGLASADRLTIIHQDVLKVCFEAFKSCLRLVGNLPYNISTPLIFHVLKFKQAIHDMHFMFQKEVGLRLCATVGSAAYGRLSVMAQYHCQTALLLDIPPQAFKPPPKVDSVFIRLTPYKKLPYSATHEVLFGQLVAQAFNHRRKMISNTLKAYLTLEDFKHLTIDPSVRPEQLSMPEFVQMSNYIHQKMANL